MHKIKLFLYYNLVYFHRKKLKDIYSLSSSKRFSLLSLSLSFSSMLTILAVISSVDFSGCIVMSSTNRGTCSLSNQMNVYFPFFSSHPQLVGQRAVGIFEEALHQIFAIYLARKTCFRSSDAHGGIDDPSKLIALFMKSSFTYICDLEIFWENRQNCRVNISLPSNALRLTYKFFYLFESSVVYNSMAIRKLCKSYLVFLWISQHH